MAEEQTANTLETCKLDAERQASVMGNGRVVIHSSESGVETVLSPEAAYSLLDVLYRHRDMLYHLAQT